MTAGMIDIDLKSLDREVDFFLTATLKTGTQVIKRQTRGLEKDLEKITQANVKGRLWRAWSSESYPKDGRGAYDPTGQVYLNGRKRTTGAIAYWTQPGVNKAKDGYWLAIPTDNAGVIGRQRDITPAEWMRRNGVDLQFIYQGAGKPALLVAEHVVFGRNGIGIRVPTKRRQDNYVRRDGTPARRITVPIFTLIPFQRFANKFSINPVIQRREKMISEDFERSIKRLPRVGR